MIPVVLGVHMVATVVIVVVSLTAVAVDVVPVTTMVASIEVAVVADLLIFSVNFSVSMAILQMFVTLGST